MLRNIILLMVIIACGFGITMAFEHAQNPAILAQSPPQQNQPAPQPLTKAPDFTIQTITGDSHALSDYRDKPVILHFWATWCAPCIVEFPKLVAFANAHQGKFTVIALSSDTQVSNITRFLDKNNITLPPNMLVARDIKQKITRDLFQTYKLPESVLINARGDITQKIVGDVAWDDNQLQLILAP